MCEHVDLTSFSQFQAMNLSSDKFCVKMVRFQENMEHLFSSLRKDPEFTDVTLVCEDGNKVEAHKVVLVASSPFFNNLLKTSENSHPLIFMTGLNFQDLVTLVDLLYYGEANIYYENIDNFLNITKELYLKGLHKEKGWRIEGEEKDDSKNIDKTTMQTPKMEPQTQLCSTPSKESHSSETAISLPKDEFSGDINELDEKINTMICRGENVVKNGARKNTRCYVCNICGKESLRTSIRDHIEAMHLSGIFIPCSICGKIFGTRNRLRSHMLTHKKKKVFVFC